jgi:hypothetical protein
MKHYLIALAAYAVLAAGTANAHGDLKTTTVLAPRPVAPTASTSPAVSALKAIVPPVVAASQVSLLQPGTWALTLMDAQSHTIIAIPVGIDPVGTDGRQQMTYCPADPNATVNATLSYLTIDLAQGTVSGTLNNKGKATIGSHTAGIPGSHPSVTLTGQATPFSADPGVFKQVTGTAETPLDSSVAAFILVPVDVTGLPHNASAPSTGCSWNGDNL